MMYPHFPVAPALAKRDSFRRAAVACTRAQPRAQAARPVAGEESVTLRFGTPADDGLLARLAGVDSSKPPAKPVLLAEVDGQLRAALALSDGTVVADPFHPTVDLIDLLRARARQVDGDSRMRRSGRSRSWSLLRAGAWG